MEQARNPYTPSAGQTPLAFVGRQAEIDAGDAIIQRTVNQRPARSIMLHGLRGVGKTVLLKELQRQAEAARWLTVEIEGKRDKQDRELTRRRLARGLVASARTVSSRRDRFSKAWKEAMETLTSFSLHAGLVQVSLGVEAKPGRSDTGDLSLDMEELVADIAPALTESKSGLAIYVDEIQDMDETTLSALLGAQHRAAQNNWPFFLFGAGLPNVPERLSAIRSYAERQFDYRSIGPLAGDDARRALSEPARRSGARYAEEALSLLVAESGGYPYFIQVFGDQAWRLADRSPISLTTARLAVAHGTAELDESLFASRWARTSRGEREFMAAMAQDEATSAVADLMDRLGKAKPSDISTIRNALIKKGLVWSPSRGTLAFSVPHMRRFILRHTD